MYINKLRNVNMEIENIFKEEGISELSELDRSSIIFLSILYKRDEDFINQLNDKELEFYSKLAYSKYESSIKKIEKSIKKEHIREYYIYDYKLNEKLQDDNLLGEGASKLSVELLDISDNDDVADFDLNNFSKLHYIIDNKKYRRLDGYELNLERNLIYKMKNYILNGVVNLREENILEEKLEVNYDKILAPSRLAASMSSDQIKIIRELYPEITDRIPRNRSEWVELLILLESLKSKGKMVKLMSLSNLSSSAYFEKDARTNIVDNGLLETVIRLPEGLLNGTSVGSAILVISCDNNKVNFIDASKLYTKKGRYKKELSDQNIKEILNLIGQETEISKVIKKEKIIQKAYSLDPRIYIEEISFKEELTLKETVIKIDRGANITNKKLERYKSNEKTKYRFLNLIDIQDGRVLDTAISLKNNLVESNEDFAKMTRLENRQLLISRTGNPIRIAVVENIEDEVWLFSGNIYSISLDENKYNPYYLKGFLESRIGKILLEQLTVGSVIPNISMKDLREFKIPNISIEEQNQMEEEYRHYYSLIIEKEKEIELLKKDMKDKMKNIFSEEEVGLCH